MLPEKFSIRHIVRIFGDKCFAPVGGGGHVKFILWRAGVQIAVIPLKDAVFDIGVPDCGIFIGIDILREYEVASQVIGIGGLVDAPESVECVAEVTPIPGVVELVFLLGIDFIRPRSQGNGLDEFTRERSADRIG